MPNAENLELTLIPIGSKASEVQIELKYRDYLKGM